LKLSFLVAIATCQVVFLNENVTFAKFYLTICTSTMHVLGTDWRPQLSLKDAFQKLVRAHIASKLERFLRHRILEQLAGHFWKQLAKWVNDRD